MDPDDKLVDVVDDREQIMAIYEEDADGIPSLQHNAGDGTSASSVGTNSPDIFQVISTLLTSSLGAAKYFSDTVV